MDNYLLDYNGLSIMICQDVFTQLSRYRQILCADKENGGMLIGSIIKGNGSLEVNDITPPQKRDNSTRSFFHRSEIHNEVLKRIWLKSNETRMYLGEWHTHPQDKPTPSSVDVDNWYKLLKTAKTDSPILLFIIIGRVDYVIFVGDRSKGSIHQIMKR